MLLGTHLRLESCWLLPSMAPHMALGDDLRLDPSISHGCFQAPSRPVCSGLGRDLADETETRASSSAIPDVAVITLLLGLPWEALRNGLGRVELI